MMIVLRQFINMNIKIYFMINALMEHIIMILNVLIAMKNVHYAQNKVLIMIYVYHAIIQINIMKNIIIYFSLILHLKIVLGLQMDFI